MNRPTITQEDVHYAIAASSLALQKKLEEKGNHIFVSTHEIDGMLSEEVREFQAAVGANEGSERIIDELLDIIVAAMHGVASIRSGNMDW